MDDETRIDPATGKKRLGRPPKTFAQRAIDAAAKKMERQERKAAQDQEKREEQTKSAFYYLTPQELRFVQSKAEGKTDEESIRIAGYRGAGGRARVRAHRIMQRPVVRAALYELLSRSWDEAKISVTQVLKETAFLAFMPPDMLEGKPTWGLKKEALKMLGDYQKLFERAAPQAGPRSIVQLIVQAGAKVTVPATIEQEKAPLLGNGS